MVAEKECVVDKGQALYSKAKKLIPGGTGLLSKRPEMYLPDYWPCYYERAKGCEVIDIDGNSFLDFTTLGVGASILGYANEDVNSAAIKALSSGNMTTLNAPEEVELAELLCDFHPWASKVKYARTGGEACTIAIRIARAFTGKTKVAFCGYHGWHDWYLSVNLGKGDSLDGHLLPGLEPNGVPEGLSETTIPFKYNDIEALKKIFHDNKGEIAGIIMEPIRNEEPDPDFLESVRDLATKNNAVLIFDEITAGWRELTSGMHMKYGVNPDIAVFGKTISNGFPMAAIIGVDPVMEAAQTTFISSAYFTDRIGPATAMKTLQIHKEINAGHIVSEMGKQVQKQWHAIANSHGLHLNIGGIPALSHFSFDTQNTELMTLFIQKMLDKGFLVTNQFYPTIAHSNIHLNEYFEAFDSTFRHIASSLQAGNILEDIRGPLKHMGFSRLI
jgi:glutamate-1-semialdehyde 2,1-aminomutase